MVVWERGSRRGDLCILRADSLLLHRRNTILQLYANLKNVKKTKYINATMSED